LSKEEARLLILTREQHYLNIIFSKAELNTYNILQVTGNLLGYNHTEETIVKLNEAMIGKNHLCLVKLIHLILLLK
jgi:hypothetical protein